MDVFSIECSINLSDFFVALHVELAFANHVHEFNAN